MPEKNADSAVRSKTGMNQGNMMPKKKAPNHHMDSVTNFDRMSFRESAGSPINDITPKTNYNDDLEIVDK